MLHKYKVYSSPYLAAYFVFFVVTVLFKIACPSDGILKIDEAALLAADEEFQGEIVSSRRNAPNYRRASGDDNCTGVRCTDFTVEPKITVDEKACTTTFCYNIKNNALSSTITEIDIFGIKYNPSDFTSKLSSWKHFACGTLSFNYPIGAGKSAELCFTLPGLWKTTQGTLLINTADASCAFSVPVPGSGSKCGSDCILDQNINNAKCEPCPAKCLDNGAYFATSSAVCTMSVLKPADPGIICNTVATAECTKACPVHCTLKGPLWPTCSPNCKTPTITVTAYYTTQVAPANGGAPCPDVIPAKSTCSLDQNQILMNCARDCVVNGFPDDPCVKACEVNKGKPTTAIATYPTTLVQPFGDGKPCPTETYDCNCKDCVLKAKPTYTAGCDATCVKFDNSYAQGQEVVHFQIDVPAIQGGKCTTTSTQPCSKLCECETTSIYNEPICTVTQTIKDVVPWEVAGFRNVYIYGKDPKCFTATTKTCRTTLKPTNCDYTLSCPATSCTITTGDPYTISTKLTCSVKTIRTADRGGQACPTTSITTQYTTTCPGCFYQGPLCACDYTSTAYPEAGITSYWGTETCVYPRETELPFIDPSLVIKPEFCPPKIAGYPDKKCSTKVNNKQCIYQADSCGKCTYTTSKIDVLPWTTLGQQTCTYVDAREPRPGQIECTPSTSVRGCSSTLKPTDCVTTTACYPCEAKCKLDDGVITSTANCQVLIYREPNYGGQNCPAINNPRPTITCTTTCNPQPVPTCAGWKDCSYNAVVFGNALLVSGDVGGRLAVEENAMLVDSDVGKELRSTFADCDDSCPGLYVGKDLSISGYVHNGKIFIGGLCAKNDISRCKKECSLNSDDCRCEKFTFDFRCVFDRVSKVSVQLLAAKRNMKLNLNQKEMTLSTFGSKFEVVAISNPKGNAPFVLGPMKLLIDGAISPTTTLIISIEGEDVLLDNLDLESINSFSSRVVWNLPNVKKLRISKTKFYAGLILAPLAELSGDGEIYGEIYVSSVKTDGLKNIEFKYRPYTGHNVLRDALPPY